MLVDQLEKNRFYASKEGETTKQPQEELEASIDSETIELREELKNQALEMLAEEDIKRREEELLTMWEQEAEKEAMEEELELMKARITRLQEEEEVLNNSLVSAKRLVVVTVLLILLGIFMSLMHKRIRL